MEQRIDRLGQQFSPNQKASEGEIKMTNYEMIKNAEDLALVLVNQEYCEFCFYNKEGLCVLVAEKEAINMFTACHNAAISWLQREAG